MKRLLLAVSTAVATLLIGAAAIPAGAAAPPSAPRGLPTPVELAGDRIHHLAERLDLLDALYSIRLDQQARSIEVLANSPLTSDVLALVGRDHRLGGVRVDVIEVAVSKRQRHRLAASVATRLGAGGTALVRENDDASGYRVTYSVPASRVAAAATRLDPAALARVGGAPVEVAYSTSLSVASTAGGGRSSDTSPFRGGAAMTSGTGDMCSTGMRAQRPSGTYVMLTAEHCLDSASSSWYAQWSHNTAGDAVAIGSGWFIGSDGATRVPTLDAGYITAASGKSFTSKIYTGHYLADTTRSVVAGWTPGEGRTAYLSGGVRGQATVRVYEDSSDVVDDELVIYDAVILRSVSGDRTNGPGDSGSPVYSVHPNGVDAIGHGILSAIIEGSDLPGSSFGVCSQGPRQFLADECGNYFVVSSLDATEDALGLEVQ